MRWHLIFVSCQAAHAYTEKQSRSKVPYHRYYVTCSAIAEETLHHCSSWLVQCANAHHSHSYFSLHAHSMHDSHNTSQAAECLWSLTAGSVPTVKTDHLLPLAHVLIIRQPSHEHTAAARLIARGLMPP